MRLLALYCPGCGAPLERPPDQTLVCSYCGALLVVAADSITEEKVAPEPASPLPARLSQYQAGRFELSLLDQQVPGSEPEWFRPFDLGDGRFALVYLRLVEAAAPDPEQAFVTLARSLGADADPGLAAYEMLEHLVGTGFRGRVETAVLLFDPSSSSVLGYNAGCSGRILWVSQEEGRTIDTGRAYEPLHAKMLRESRDYFSNAPRLYLAGDDLVVAVSAAYTALGALSNSLNENLGEHPLRVVTLAKNAFWKEHDPKPRSHLRVAAVRVMPVQPAVDGHPAVVELVSGQYETALIQAMGDFVKLLPLHDDRAVLVWLSLPGGAVDPERGEKACEAVLALLDRRDYGDNENPRRAGREALEAIAAEDALCLAVIQFFHRYHRVKYYRKGWKQAVALGHRGVGSNDSIQQFDEGGEATVSPGCRLFFPGALDYPGSASRGEDLARLWRGGKSSALYRALVSHWRTKRSAPALEKLALAVLGDGGVPEGLALVSNRATD